MADFTQKMKTYFTRIDSDHDGAITRKDFEELGGRFVEGAIMTSERGAELRQDMCDVWDKYLCSIAQGKPIQEAPFIAAMAGMVADPGLKQCLLGPLDLFFRAIDTNHDHLIQLEEYEAFFTTLGMDKALAAPSFQAIDTNNDGDISRDEFLAAGQCFFLGGGGRAADLFWGPLV